MSTKLNRHAPWQEIGRDGLPPRPGTRQPAPEDPAVAAEKEGVRLRLRERLKRQLAESDVAESRVEEIYQAIGTLNNEKERLASQHVAECGPLQNALTELHKRRVDRLLVGESDAPGDDERRIELQNEIEQANQRLEKSIADIDETLARLQTELRGVAKGINPTLRNDLTHSASTENRVKMQVALSRNEFLRRRVEQLAEAIRERRQDMLLQAMLADAAMMLSDSERLSKAAIAACVNE